MNRFVRVGSYMVNANHVTCFSKIKKRNGCIEVIVGLIGEYPGCIKYEYYSEKDANDVFYNLVHNPVVQGLPPTQNDQSP